MRVNMSWHDGAVAMSDIYAPALAYIVLVPLGSRTLLQNEANDTHTASHQDVTRHPNTRRRLS